MIDMRKLLTTFLIAAAACFSLGAQDINLSQDSLTEGFRNPPRDARPRVWWHWMNGNITREGIRRDLLWMDKVGVVGFHNFDAGLESPQIVEKRLPYMTPEWKEAFNYALDLADSLGMEVTIASSPGWSVTGGPWVKPEDAMKKLTWVETVVEGGRSFRGALPEPHTTSDDFQGLLRFTGNRNDIDYYRDIAVVAVKLHDDDLTMEEMGAKLTSCAEPAEDGQAWICCEFPQPRTIKSVTLATSLDDSGHFNRAIECSDDGEHWKVLLNGIPDTMTPVKSFSIPATTAKYFRLRSNVPGERMEVLRFDLSQVTRVEISAEKSGFYVSASMRDFHQTPHTDDAVSLGDVVDLTSRYRGGVLSWKVPQGRWRIYRFGYNLTGKVNSPASPEATGLEVDKFDAQAVKRYYHNYFDFYNTASRDRVGKVISHLMIDSYEARCQNWTPKMEQEFRSRKGYSLRTWLPALAGQVLGSAEQTERFLFDWREVLSNLMAENHYDVVNEVLAEYGMKRYTESQEQYRAYVADGMDVKRAADIPMSAFWINAEHTPTNTMHQMDIRESASVAHIYGQNICAAESFTASGKSWHPEMKAFSHYPGRLKKAADAALASGLNRFVIHCSVHQSTDDKLPGMGLGKYGQWFNRHETWADEARAWTDYLARSSYLLQQGRFTADIAYYYGETTNLTARFKKGLPQVPEGWNYDFVNKTVLLDVLNVDNGHLTTPSGMSYSALLIDDEVFYMSVPVLRRIREIADAGILVAGSEPLDHTDLMGSDDEFRALVKDIWHSGRKNVVPNVGIEPLLPAKDVDVVPQTGADFRFVHRSLADGEIYWVANISSEYRTADVSFRVSGYEPVILHPETGEVEQASWAMRDGRTIVHLDMVPDDALFILFMTRTERSSSLAAQKTRQVVGTIGGEWEVAFQQGRGAPERTVLPRLASLDENEDPGIRYFSGTAVYTRKFEIGGLDSGCEYWLDLGRVCNMARVKLNGRDLGLVWKAPFRFNATDALVEGENRLEISVTNTWMNRLIGDEQPGVEHRITWTAMQFYTAEDKTMPSGLLGPVNIECATTY